MICNYCAPGVVPWLVGRLCHDLQLLCTGCSTLDGREAMS